MSKKRPGVPDYLSLVIVAIGLVFIGAVGIVVFLVVRSAARWLGIL